MSLKITHAKFNGNLRTTDKVIQQWRNLTAASMAEISWTILPDLTWLIITMGSCTAFKINRDFGRNSQFFHTEYLMLMLSGFPLKFRNGNEVFIYIHYHNSGEPKY